MPTVGNTPRNKPTHAFRVGLRERTPLTNVDEHLGRFVKIVRTYRREVSSLLGATGRIVDVYTAEFPRGRAGDVTCRGVYYDIETPTAIVIGVDWTEFLQVHKENSQ